MARSRMRMDGITLLMFKVSSLKFRVARLNLLLSVTRYTIFNSFVAPCAQLETSNQ